MEVTQPLRVGLGLAVGLNPQYSHPVCMTTKLKHSCNNQGFTGISSMGISLTQEKQYTGNNLMGMGEVQTLQMNQSQNDDVINVNRQRTDGLNE